MAVLILVADDKGNVIRVERREEGDFFDRLGTAYRSGEIAVKGTTFHLTSDVNVYQFNTVLSAIRDSPHLTAEQRAEALRLFNEFKPGDVFASRVDRGIIRQGGDTPKAPPPLFTVFIDP
jgi:hypothetical protein